MRVALAGMQDRALGRTPHCPQMLSLQKLWHWRCSPQQAVEGEKNKFGFKVLPNWLSQTLLFPPKGLGMISVATFIVRISHHCHRLAVTLPPTFPT